MAGGFRIYGGIAGISLALLTGCDPAMMQQFAPGNQASSNLAPEPAKPVIADGQRVETSLAAGETRVERAGYSHQFQAVRGLLRVGSFELAVDEMDRLVETRDAEAKAEVELRNQNDRNSEQTWRRDRAERDQDVSADDPVLTALERGVLYLNIGNATAAEQQFAAAEEALIKRQEGSKAGDFFRSMMSGLTETLIGSGETGRYTPEPFEELLLLNYKSLAYLLLGDRRAYNVARRAADRQNEQRAEFVKDLKESAADRRQIKQRPQGRSRDLSDVEGWLGTIVNRYSNVAARVPSAYVNSLGFYVVGMINEIESYADPSLRDNARIAYSKALELNPDSEVLRRAVTSTTHSFARDDHKVIHVMAGIGLAPEKRVASYGLQADDQGTILPLKFPIYQPIADRVARIEVRDASGFRVFGTLSNVADIEAIMLRYQKDHLPIEIVQFILGLYPRLFERSVWSGLGPLGEKIAQARDASINPDMRSWSALPSRVHALRLEVPRGTNQLQIISYDERGQRLAIEDVRLTQSVHAFVYARAVDKALSTSTGHATWLQGDV